ncbi:hypothetical protein D0N37_20915 [Pseudoalteromonas piscicida]|nr:hypothetical protein D0N37_20915 [Pseudoalteromonas piscicida]
MEQQQMLVAIHPDILKVVGFTNLKFTTAPAQGETYFVNTITKICSALNSLQNKREHASRVWNLCGLYAISSRNDPAVKISLAVTAI